jgi:enoyl-CoA hydratase
MDEDSPVLTERHGRVGLLRLNRPKALNALNAALIERLDAELRAMDRDPEIGAIVIAGSERAFAAGADIREMQARGAVDAYLDDFLARWDGVARTRKPLIAAVAGLALGGGCELALMCDLVIAAPTAQFGQPEIKLGVPPGAGGTQRLTRAIGKAKAMDLCLTGRLMGAEEAERVGLVSRLAPAAKVTEEALAVAQQIAGMSLPIALMVKESVNRAFETSLAEGLRGERRLFYSAFATDDQKEGMSAFLEKRPPAFKNR